MNVSVLSATRSGARGVSHGDGLLTESAAKVVDDAMGAWLAFVRIHLVLPRCLSDGCRDTCHVLWISSLPGSPGFSAIQVWSYTCISHLTNIIIDIFSSHFLYSMLRAIHFSPLPCSDLGQGVAISTTAFMLSRFFVQTHIFSVSPSSFSL